MKNYKPPETESSPTDPFLAVMNKEYDGHRRLFGRGVTNTIIKKVKAGGSSNMAASEIVQSSTTSLEAENGQHADKYRNLEEGMVTKLMNQLAAQGEQLQSMSTKLTPLDEIGCENDASIQKSNGLATSEKEMETRETVNSV
nr:hypothetical protein [Tanacetum cinerariifolium]